MDQSTSNPFSFVDRTLNLLIVEDDTLGRELLLDMLSPVSCYKLYTATTNGKALELLRSGVRFHGCITDLGIDDVENDEFYLLRQYARHSSIIVLTGSPSPQKGATCIQLGARAVFEKGMTFSNKLFFKTLNYMVLINIVNHRYNEKAFDTLNSATRALFETEPASVTEWADQLRITDRQLRNLWHTGSGFGAKHVLYLFQCFSQAFEYYENMLFESDDELYRPSNRINKKRLAAYYQNQHEILSFMLS